MLRQYETTLTSQHCLLSLVEDIKINSQKVKFTTALLPAHLGITNESIVYSYGIQEFKLLGDVYYSRRQVDIL